MPFTATTVNSAAAWRPDLYEFAPADALPEALILQCTTQAGSVEGDAKDTENEALLTLMWVGERVVWGRGL